jgi:hypothetical protein
MIVPAQALETEAREHCLQASKLNTRGDSKQGVKPKSQRQKKSEPTKPNPYSNTHDAPQSLRKIYCCRSILAQALQGSLRFGRLHKQFP